MKRSYLQKKFAQLFGIKKALFMNYIVALAFTKKIL